MPVTKCNGLPYPQNATPTQKCMRGGGAVVAITIFVVGLLSLLTSLNLLSTALGPVGTVGSSCMMGGGVLILLALFYLKRSGAGAIPFQMQTNRKGGGGTYSQPEGNVSVIHRSLNESLQKDLYPEKFKDLQEVAISLKITDIEARLKENFGGIVPEITLQKTGVNGTETHNFQKSASYLLLKEEEFMNLRLYSVGHTTTLAAHSEIDALCLRFHSIQTKAYRRTNPLTIGDIPHLSGTEISTLYSACSFPDQALFCLSPSQIKEFAKILETSSPYLLGMAIKSLFSRSTIGHYATQHMKKLYQALEGFTVLNEISDDVRKSLSS